MQPANNSDICIYRQAVNKYMYIHSCNHIINFMHLKFTNLLYRFIIYSKFQCQPKLNLVKILQ